MERDTRLDSHTISPRLRRKILRSRNERHVPVGECAAAHENHNVKVVIVSALLAALTAVTAISTASLNGFDPNQRAMLGFATGASWALAVAAFLVLLRIGGRAAVVLVFAGSAALSIAALVGPPNLSNDSARYAWDGIVQNNAISPYANVPAADALAQLRPAWLFPSPIVGVGGIRSCEGLGIVSSHTVPAGDLLCTAINRPQVPTIYPPVAEAFFAAVRAFVPTAAQYWPLQVAGLALSLATTALLVVGMSRRKLDLRWAALWGWSPFVAAEAVTNAHVDALGTFIILAATFAATPVLSAVLSRKRAVLVGVGIGLAAAAKFLPALAGPPLARRHTLIVGLSAGATFALTYVPYVLSTGWAVIGYLPGYLSEEGYSTGSRFVLLSPLLPGLSATIAAAGLILAAVAVTWWRTDPTAPWHAQTILIGTALLIASPSYTWYALVLIPFIALSRRWEWLTVPVALMVRPLLAEPWEQLTLFLAAVVVCASMTVYRARMAGRGSKPIVSVDEPADGLLRKEQE